LGYAFAAGLEITFRPGTRFENKDPPHSSSQKADVFLRIFATQFFIRVDEDDRSESRFDPQLMESFQSENHLSQTGLHVIDAGPRHESILDAHRHLLERSYVPHRIAVTKQQLCTLSSGSLLRSCIEHPSAGLSG